MLRRNQIHRHKLWRLEGINCWRYSCYSIISLVIYTIFSTICLGLKCWGHRGRIVLIQRVCSSDKEVFLSIIGIHIVCGMKEVIKVRTILGYNIWPAQNHLR